jgi:hypothetical protein
VRSAAVDDRPFTSGAAARREHQRPAAVIFHARVEPAATSEQPSQ